MGRGNRHRSALPDLAENLEDMDPRWAQFWFGERDSSESPQKSQIINISKKQLNNLAQGKISNIDTVALLQKIDVSDGWKEDDLFIEALWSGALLKLKEDMELVEWKDSLPEDTLYSSWIHEVSLRLDKSEKTALPRLPKFDLGRVPGSLWPALIKVLPKEKREALFEKIIYLSKDNPKAFGDLARGSLLYYWRLDNSEPPASSEALSILGDKLIKEWLSKPISLPEIPEPILDKGTFYHNLLSVYGNAALIATGRKKPLDKVLGKEKQEEYLSIALARSFDPLQSKENLIGSFGYRWEDLCKERPELNHLTGEEYKQALRKLSSGGWQEVAKGEQDIFNLLKETLLEKAEAVQAAKEKQEITTATRSLVWSERKDSSAVLSQEAEEKIGDLYREWLYKTDPVIYKEAARAVGGREELAWIWGRAISSSPDIFKEALETTHFQEHAAEEIISALQKELPSISLSEDGSLETL